MALPLIAALPAGIQALKAGLPLGIKALKYFVDSTFRDKVAPVPGSVLYCDLWVAVEHSGIYVGGGDISNIVVDGVAESTVCRSSPESFTSKSVLGRKIYVDDFNMNRNIYLIYNNLKTLSPLSETFVNFILKKRDK